MGGEFQAENAATQNSSLTNRKQPSKGSKSNVSMSLGFLVCFDLNLFEVKLFREERSGLGRPIANQRLLLCVKSVEVNVARYPGKLINSLDIGDISIFDSSSHMSICMLGPQINAQKRTNMLNRPETTEFEGSSEDENFPKAQLSVVLSVDSAE
eukprot:534717-Ditylum_brightwellii.AAC.1